SNSGSTKYMIFARSYCCHERSGRARARARAQAHQSVGTLQSRATHRVAHGSHLSKSKPNSNKLPHPHTDLVPPSTRRRRSRRSLDDGGTHVSRSRKAARTDVQGGWPHTNGKMT